MTDQNTIFAGDASELPEKMQNEAALLLAEIEAPEPDHEPEATADEPVSREKIDQMLAGFLFLTFNQVIAPRRGEHWAMTDAECAALGEAYGDLLEKYFPELKVGPEVAAIVVSVAVFGPRIGQDVVIARKAAKAAKADKATQAADESEDQTKAAAEPVREFNDEPVHENEA